MDLKTLLSGDTIKALSSFFNSRVGLAVLVGAVFIYASHGIRDDVKQIRFVAEMALQHAQDVPNRLAQLSGKIDEFAKFCRR
jgi:hypothetical protein